ncbi:MAG: hypothetical protein NTY76_00740 [Candidatus Omnitrophica bacterium]|nr:hypothetical protein [Candidatus Omnitrophota bacterium]
MSNKTKKIITVTLLIFLSPIFINTCYANLTYYDDVRGGFWQGLWHGIISFIKLPASVLAPQSLHLYNSNNNGLAYNTGFFIPAIAELEMTIPLLIVAWILRGIFWVIMAAIALSFGAVKT